ncbi:unnamed protein product [Gordionus sp. m RMFG-2023]
MKLLIAYFAIFQVFVKSNSKVPISENLVQQSDGLKTDDNLLKREPESLVLDGLNTEEAKVLKSKMEKFQYQAEVDRMMKLIINSLYKNKEIFLRELISNAADALDKIRFLSVTDSSVLDTNKDLKIMIKVDKENHILHIIDTGIGMTKEDLINNLGTIARSGTSEFLKTFSDGSSHQASDLIGQFGVGFYASFLVADRVVVVSKNNMDDTQHIWESDAESFSVAADPRGNTLGRGTQVSLYMKEETQDFLEENTLRDLIKKYSQFINFPIYLYEKSVEKVPEPDMETVKPEEKEGEETVDKKSPDDDEDTKVEEVNEDKVKKAPKTVEKTVWDWKIMNGAKPIWTRKPADIKSEEYVEFYKAISKETQEPLAYIHFNAEGELTFKSILYIGKSAPANMFTDYGKKVDHIKLYVRRVFITSDFDDMMPKYLSFVIGIVDSDDLPLNVSRETLQHSKLLKVIKKKLIRKVLDMIKKLGAEDFIKFWKEYSTNMKLGVVEDPSNRNRLARLVRFFSSYNETEAISLSSYVERMKDKQEFIYFVAGQNMAEVKNSPFVERLLKKGYEVLYLTESIDEYCIQALPEFDGKKFMNVAKEGLKLDEGKKGDEKQKEMEKKFEPLTTWLKENGLKDKIEKSQISQRLAASSCALVASTYGWSGNMERLMKSSAYAKTNDPMSEYYANMKKTLEINPRHPLIKELLRRVEEDKEDELAKDIALVLFETATLRSGYNLADTKGYSNRVEKMMKMTFNLADSEVEPEEHFDVDEEEEEESDSKEDGGDKDEEDVNEQETTKKESPDSEIKDEL